MWVNYKWIRIVRGITPREHRVLSYLCDAADQNGYIEKLTARRMASECETTPNNIFRILNELQHTKRFVVSRTNRFGAAGEQVSNAYRIDLDRYRPFGEDHGLRMWEGLVKEIGEGAPLRSVDSDGYYNPESKTLSLWFDSPRDKRYFEGIRKQLLTHGRTHSPKIKRFEFLVKLPPKEAE